MAAIAFQSQPPMSTHNNNPVSTQSNFHAPSPAPGQNPAPNAQFQNQNNHSGPTGPTPNSYAAAAQPHSGYQSSVSSSGVTSPTHSTITITNGTTIPVTHTPGGPAQAIQTITPILHGKPVTSSSSYEVITTNNNQHHNGAGGGVVTTTNGSGILPIPKEIIDKVKWETEACFYVPIAAKELAQTGVIHLPLNEVEKAKAHQLLDYCLFGEGANLYRNVLAKGDALRFREKLASFDKKEPKSDVNISAIEDQLKFEIKNEITAQLKAEIKSELRSQLRAEIMDEVHTEISKVNARIDKLQNYMVELHNKQGDELAARIVAVANRVDGLKREFNTFVHQVHIKDMNKVLLAAGRWAHPVPTLKGSYGPDNLETWNDGRWTLYIPDVIKKLPADQLDQWLESYCIGEHSRNFTFLKDCPTHVKRSILFHFIGGKNDPNFFPSEQKALHF